MIYQRWLKSYHVDFGSNPDDNADISHQVEYDLLPEPPMQSTLKMLNLCQKLHVKPVWLEFLNFEKYTALLKCHFTIAKQG